MTYCVETWARLHGDPDFPRLVQEHYAEAEEVAQEVPVSLNVPIYESLDRNGMLVIVTARLDGLLVGYCTTMMHRHMHYDLMCAIEDAYYVVPWARRLGHGLVSVGYRLIATMIEELRRRGCQRCSFAAKDFSPLLERLGMRRGDIMYGMWL